MLLLDFSHVLTLHQASNLIRAKHVSTFGEPGSSSFDSFSLSLPQSHVGGSRLPVQHVNSQA